MDCCDLSAISIATGRVSEQDGGLRHPKYLHRDLTELVYKILEYLSETPNPSSYHLDVGGRRFEAAPESAKHGNTLSIL